MSPFSLLWCAERLELAVVDFHLMRGAINRRKQLAHIARLRARVIDVTTAELRPSTGLMAEQAISTRDKAVRAADELLIERAERVMGYV